MKEKLHILCHSLGRDEFGESKSKINNGEDFRNHFCTGPGIKDFDLCREMVGEGLMTEGKPTEISGGYHVFWVTEKGKEFIALNAPKRPKISQAKARYRRFLEFGEYFESFIDFCRWDAAPDRNWNRGVKS